MNLDLRLLPTESGLFVPDILYGKARQMGDVVLGDRGGPAGFARNDHPVGRRQRFAGNPYPARVPAESGAEVEKCINDLVGDSVAHLIGVTFGNRLAGKEI